MNGRLDTKAWVRRSMGSRARRRLVNLTPLCFAAVIRLRSEAVPDEAVGGEVDEDDELCADDEGVVPPRSPEGPVPMAYEGHEGKRSGQ